MDDSVTVCNLESELSSENEDIEKSHTVSTNQQITVVVNSAKDLQKHSNRSRMLSDSWGNLRVAMIKQAKMLNHRFKIKPSQRLTSEFPYKKKMKNYSILVNKKISITKEAEVALEQPEASTSNNIHNESLLDHHSLSSQKENDIEMDEFEDLSKQNSNALNTTKSCKSENNTYSSDETVQIDLSKVHSQVEEQVSPTILKHEKISYDILGTTINKNMKADEMKLESLAAGLSVLKKPLIVRKPTLTMNGLENDLNNLPKIVAVRSLQKPAGIIAKANISLNANKIKVVPYLKPKIIQQNQTNEEIHKLAEKTADHKFPKSITVKKAITLSTADHDNTEYKPFRANIGGRFVTLRRLKTTLGTSDVKKYCCATGTCDPACSTKQLTTKMCVRKAPDGTYRVTSNNNMNINGLTIKKFKSNCQNNELSKIDTPVPKLLNRFPKAVVNYTDDDNRPSTSSRAIIRKTTTMTSSVVPPKQINDNEQYVMSTVTMPIKYNKQNKSNSDEVLQDNDKLRKNQTLKITHQNKIMSRRNTLFVPKLQELAKEESYKLNTKPQNGTTIRRNSYFNSKLQEPTKNGCYTIPQSLLSSTEPLADTSSESISKQSLRSLESPPNGEDLFLIQKDPPRKQPSVPIMDPTQRRRKAALKPKRSFSEETKTFEHIEEHFNMPARPRQNIQLIESLARYRTIVKFILNHLDINQIDFNNDDYINLYKFNRG